MKAQLPASAEQASAPSSMHQQARVRVTRIRARNDHFTSIIFLMKLV
jgi:hypothetical protein